jgi:hypothetical protein
MNLMFTAYVVVGLLTAVANVFSAAHDFRPTEALLNAGAELGVQESWLPMLGILKAAGALGLLIGIGMAMPSIGTAAAVGLVVYFVGASIFHLRACDYSFGPQYVFLLLAVATLVLGLVS